VTAGNIDQEIKRRQEELAKIRKDIELFEQRIRESEQRESATLELLDNYDKQALLLRKLVGTLREEEKRLQREIDGTRKSISELRNQVSFLKHHYAKYIRSAYKYGRTYDLELLMSSRSLNQALVRAEYLQRFSSQRRNDLTKIETKRTDIERQNLVLQSQLTQQRQLITEKSREERRLQTAAQQRKKVLADIRKDKSNYRTEIDRKRAAARDIEQLIAKLIEEERIRKEREEALARERKERTPEPEAVGDFEGRRGKLRWPVARGSLAAKFGDQQHPVLKTITQNTGIDISVPSGSDVVAVAPGEVSTIWWLPSFGNLVIVNHYSGYRTVYAHLSDIDVREGEKVGEGDRIGKSGESLAGPMVHFEVWKLREKQDPELWLRPRELTRR
jgi:septal ring factor EnvC (AmiA/AmiB activator)